MDKVYDINKAIVLETEVALALLDTNNKAVMVIKPKVIEQKDPNTGVIAYKSVPEFEIIEPDGEERLDWLLRLGAMTVAEVEQESAKLDSVQKKQLAERLLKEVEQ